MTEWRTRLKLGARKVGAFLFKHHLPLGLIFAVVLGGSWPTPGLALSKIPSNYICVIGIFIISGLKLKTDDVKTALKSWKAIIYGIISILFVTSAIALELVKTLDGHFGSLQMDSSGVNGTGNGTDMGCSSVNSTEAAPVLGPREFSTGLQVFYAMPCTVSSGVVLVSQMNGNYALSLLLTVIANLVGIGTVPGLLNWLGKFSASVQLDAAKLLLKLIYTLLVPLLFGKALRFIPKVAELVDKHRTVLKVTSNVLLTILPWIKISVTSDRGSFDCVMAVSVLAIFGITFALHAVLLVLNTVAALVLRLEVPAAKVIVVLCSQKTLAVALSVLTFFPASLGDQGLMSVPCIIAHLVQIIVDAIIVSAWLSYDKRQELKNGGGDAADRGDGGGGDDSPDDAMQLVRQQSELMDIEVDGGDFKLKLVQFESST